MLLLDFLRANVSSERVIFEYGYYGLKGSFMKDEELSKSGNIEELIDFINTTGNLKYLFACSGECNDFEIVRSNETIQLRYIDFR
ncbi:MAG: hypothetical protein MJ087_05810 [Lachnospiraceae bacterium]|nr:hypothetical protein [Lachnospiraceae bacterium]